MSWKEENNKLVKEFEFPDFIRAFSFLTQVAILAEKANHHPEIYNVYNRVKLSLNTHDEGNIVTETDRQLALQIDGLLS
jgi:4a-hydroxytetrahydrobiopterin dehydratase